MDEDKEIEVIANVMSYRHVGVIQQIEYQRLQEICKYFDIPLTKENYPYCLSVKATLDGFAWEDTKDGIDYWQDVYKRLLRIAKEGF